MEKLSKSKRAVAFKSICIALLFGFFMLSLSGCAETGADSGSRQSHKISFKSKTQKELDQLKESMDGKELTIILDAGHGGSDVGAGDESYWEKDINLDVVNRLYDMLTYCGVNVILTRTDDFRMELDERSTLANEHPEADYFVSIHCNVCEGDDSVSGMECYYWEGSEKGKEFSEVIMKTVEKYEQIETHDIRTNNFHVLRETRMPAVLIEVGYLSNEAEKKKLYKKSYQKKLALNLTRGIIAIVQ